MSDVYYVENLSPSFKWLINRSAFWSILLASQWLHSWFMSWGDAIWLIHNYIKTAQSICESLKAKRFQMMEVFLWGSPGNCYMHMMPDMSQCGSQSMCTTWCVACNVSRSQHYSRSVFDFVILSLISQTIFNIINLAFYNLNNSDIPNSAGWKHLG